jgi:hypothetical protein
MRVKWNTYPNHIGHQESPGCFRCHDNKHKTDDGEKIGKKCSTCHNVVADEESGFGAAAGTRHPGTTAGAGRAGHRTRGNDGGKIADGSNATR